MAILQYLDISSQHIPPADLDVLNGLGDSEPLIMYDYREGWWIHISSDAGIFHDCLRNVERTGLSGFFTAILSYAREQKCEFIRLDADGDLIDDLPLFEY